MNWTKIANAVIVYVGGVVVGIILATIFMAVIR